MKMEKKQELFTINQAEVRVYLKNETEKDSKTQPFFYIRKGVKKQERKLFQVQKTTRLKI